MKAFYFDGPDGAIIREEEIPAEYLDEAKAARQAIIEGVAEVDEELGELFLNDAAISNEQIKAAIRRATIALKMTPVMCGSAYRTRACSCCSTRCATCPAPRTSPTRRWTRRTTRRRSSSTAMTKPFVGLAFKLEDGRYGADVHAHLPGDDRQGRLHLQPDQPEEGQGSPHRRMHSNEMNDITEATAGDIVALFGVECASGDTFTNGDVSVTMTSMHVPDAVISLAVAPKDRTALANFSKALNRFTKEDPTFRVQRGESARDHHQRHGRAAPRDLHRAHEARVRLRGGRR